jgi:hypothetical protein
MRCAIGAARRQSLSFAVSDRHGRGRSDVSRLARARGPRGGLARRVRRRARPEQRGGRRARRALRSQRAPRAERSARCCRCSWASVQEPPHLPLFARGGDRARARPPQRRAVIFTVVLLNALIGTLQEGRAERSLEALRKLATHKARVVRGGQEVIVEAREVVPGDVSCSRRATPSPPTPPAPRRRAPDRGGRAHRRVGPGRQGPPAARARHPLADRRNMVYAGTHVTAGRARAWSSRPAWRPRSATSRRSPRTAKESKTPLERRIAQFGRYIILRRHRMFVIGHGDRSPARAVPSAQIVMIGISQVVGMIPEGLPVAMTIALAVGVQRMATRRPSCAGSPPSRRWARRPSSAATRRARSPATR